jgi:hypothetical protein
MWMHSEAMLAKALVEIRAVVDVNRLYRHVGVVDHHQNSRRGSMWPIRVDVMARLPA